MRHRLYGGVRGSLCKGALYSIVEILEKRGFYKEAEDLQKIAEKYYLPENRTIILKVIIEMQKAAVSDEETKLEQLLQQL